MKLTEVFVCADIPPPRNAELLLKTLVPLKLIIVFISTLIAPPQKPAKLLLKLLTPVKLIEVSVDA